MGVGINEPYLEITGSLLSPADVTVARLVQPLHEAWTDSYESPTVQTIYSRLVADYLEKEKYKNPILWLSTPKGVAFAKSLQYGLLVYEWMVRPAQYEQQMLG